MAAWRGPVTIDVRIPALPPPSLSPPTTHYPVLASKVNRGRAGQGGFFGGVGDFIVGCEGGWELKISEDCRSRNLFIEKNQWTKFFFFFFIHLSLFPNLTALFFFTIHGQFFSLYID